MIMDFVKFSRHWIYIPTEHNNAKKHDNNNNNNANKFEVVYFLTCSKMAFVSKNSIKTVPWNASSFF